MMAVPKKYILAAFLIITVYALALNEWNIRAIRKDNPSNTLITNQSLIYNYTVASVDNNGYLLQIKNYMAGRGFTADPSDPRLSVRRSPVYPLFYAAHYLLFGERLSFFFIRYTQVILFAGAAIALFFAVFNFTGSQKTALLTGMLFGFNPTLVSYLYYTITESLSASLVCFLLYALSLCWKYNSKRNWLYGGLLFALAVLCRPAIVLIAPSVLFLFLVRQKNNIRNILGNGIFFILGALVLLIPNTIRNYRVTNGDMVVLEKYYGDPMYYGMPNIDLRHWIACWINPADYPSENISNRMILHIGYDKTSTREELIDNMMQTIPVRAFAVNKREDIRNAYSLLYDYYKAKEQGAPLSVISPLELKAGNALKGLKSDFIRKAPLRYYLVSPLLFLKSLVFQSNSANIYCLNGFRNDPLKRGMKGILYLLNIGLFFSLIANILFVRKYRTITLFSNLFFVVSFLYILCEIRYFETRYLVPIFPVLYISGAVFGVVMVQRLKRRLHL